MLYIWSAFDFMEWRQKNLSLPYEQTFFSHGNVVSISDLTEH